MAAITNIDNIVSPAPIPRSPMPWRSPILMDMFDSAPGLNEASLHDPTPIDVSTTVHEVQYKIVSETSIRGRDKLFDTPGYSYTAK